MALSLGHLFHTIIINKGSQVTKPIIAVKICYKLLYVIKVVKKTFAWPQLISKFLVAPVCNAASDWPCTFFIPRVFLFSIYITMKTYSRYLV